MVKCKKACPTNFPSVNLRNTRLTEFKKLIGGNVENVKKVEAQRTANIKVYSAESKEAKQAFKVDIVLG